MFEPLKIPHKRITQLLRQFTVLVQPSVYEFGSNISHRFELPGQQDNGFNPVPLNAAVAFQSSSDCIPQHSPRVY